MFNNIILGSSIACLIFRKKLTASLPSIILWSYVNAKYIIGLIVIYFYFYLVLITFPLTTTGRSLIACIPRIAD